MSVSITAKYRAVCLKNKNADERLFMTWIVDVLENGKSDFVKEKLSILGEKYDAASAILYFKSQK